jgi:hypothetical protein
MHTVITNCFLISFMNFHCLSKDFDQKWPGFSSDAVQKHFERLPS